MVTHNRQRCSLKIINYHYKGACFEVTAGDFRPLDKQTKLNFYIGRKELKEKITYRVVWETIDENGLFGVEFTGLSSYALERAERFKSHSINIPVVTSQDPLDPNRIIYFNVKNMSTTGLLLGTSLTNKHIFPGMELNNAKLTIPDMGEIKLNLYIENCRSVDDKREVDYGVSIQNVSPDYIDLVSRYTSSLYVATKDEDRLSKLAKSNLVNKELSKHLTIKIVESKEDYEKVLKLRFLGYSKAGKTKKSTTYKEMGDGIENEGFVLAAYLGGQLIASCEFRINKIHKLRLLEKIDLFEIDGIDNKNISEINKLVVHPNAKGTDVVLGIFQKIHTLATINGAPDGIILSEPKLVSLYERLGFHKLNYQTEHTTKENTFLQLMLIKGETYSSSKGMNPYAWSLAFELSHEFFTNIGLQKKIHFTNKQRFIKTITKHYLKYFRKKKAPDTKVAPSDTKLVDRDVSNPKWTKQHINATVLLPYILEAEKIVGEKEVTSILFKFSFKKEYFRKVSNWVSIDFFDEFISLFSELGDPYLLNKSAGYRATSREILGANYFIMKHFFSPRVAFKAFEKYFPKFNKTRIYKVTDSGINYCKIKITNPDKSLIPKHHSTRENWIALLDAYVQIITGKPATIDVLKSTFDGDSYCEYVVKWKNPILKNRLLLLSIPMSLIVLGKVYLFTDYTLNIDPTSLLITTLSISCLFAIFYWRRSNSRYKDIIESMHEFENNADIKYEELQNSKLILEKNYQESKLLESINRKIQTTDELSEILQIALETSCTKFGFKRAFIMILDNNDKLLRTASVYGASNTVVDLWKFTVDTSAQRKNPALLSSVFHTGQPIIINDIEQHLFHLNDQSKMLIKSLEVNAFSIIPIPSENKNWGVLVADKGQSNEQISRRDLVSLKRISQSIGLALDKKSKLDTEITTRKVFQKYVPSWLVDMTLKNQEPQLGGTSKEALCLFLDIRNFTAMTALMPAEILVNMLNDVFHILQETVAENGGVIDKFLGDGALVTWGIYPWSALDPNLAIKTANSFMSKLSELNETLKPSGIPHIEVGFGIHKGKVIAGNIGSNDRMEFTVIGSTVNIASRLEQLTKKFETNIVISEDVIDFKKLSKKWVVHQKVKIRGITEPRDVACFKYKKAE